MASLFRQHAAPMRSQLYPPGMQPVASADVNRTLHRRVSRTDLDFEQALRAEGTVLLKEGPDVNAMGVDRSSSSIDMSVDSFTLTPQPGTPTIVPPAPSSVPVAGPSMSAGCSSSRSSSSQDIFYDAEDTERQTNRRSMYRSTGTSSSPDLATLVRKAKEKGGTVPAHLAKNHKQRESPPPIPTPPPSRLDRPLSSGRPRSSTSYSAHAAPPPPTGPRSRPIQNATNVTDANPVPERVVVGPRPYKEPGSAKAPKSLRAKTSTLLGKIMGQSGSATVREVERSRTDTIHPITPTYPYTPQPADRQQLTPPVPPLPMEHHRNAISPEPLSPTQRAMLDSKPLPPVIPTPAKDPPRRDVSDSSIVFVDKVHVQEFTSSKPSQSPTNSKSTKHRSVSIGEVDMKKTMISSSTPSSASPSPVVEKNVDGQHLGDTNLNHILDDFKGELSQLDPTGKSNLDLRDPMALSRRNVRLNVDEIPFGHMSRDSEKSATQQSPVLSLRIPSPLAESPEKCLPSPIIPPRSSSLQKPRPLPRPSSIGPQHSVSPRHASSPLRSRTGPPGPQVSRDASRLRALHRSTASNSEPSLIPAGEDVHVFPISTPTQDSTTNELTSGRFTPGASSATSAEENGDVETRAKELASRCWDEDEAFLQREKIAEWLGSNTRLNKLTLHHYVEYFDFSSLRLDMAFRRLCGKLYLKGETQQVDRILEAFSKRYWECNPQGLYGNANIVHAVAYSLLLLNTDLHVADLTSRMSRNQFIRNTLAAIQAQLQPSSPQISSSDSTYDDCSSVRTTDIRTRSKRSDSITSWSSVSKDGLASITIQDNGGSSPSLPTPTAHDIRTSPGFLHNREWENDMETLLKEMYNAIKSQQILQPLNSSLGRSSSSLSPGGTMLRHRSFRGQPDRLTTLKRGSIRGLQSILNQSGVSPYSSNSSIEGRVSPSPSFATSTHEGMSSSAFLAPSLGFASNLSHTIIRETREDDDRSVLSAASTSTTISITDEELALLGPPWAKEGMLCRKQYWESSGKRARDKSWMDVFVVIQKGELSMFTFGDHTNNATGTFGGGNWLTNADPAGTVHLAHSLAHALPPPGYNRQRPHCMVLTMANGAVYFFQAGTEELVNEWVSTCNYWAARTSKEPLTGGVSNMEYGWNRVADLNGHKRAQTDGESTKDQSDSMSVRSGRSTRSKFGWKDGSATVRTPHSPWVEKIMISDWKPPLPPIVASVHDEESQLEALRKHVKTMKKELERHNDLREPMNGLYQPRTTNAVKSLANWEKKSQYLLTEIVKYDSYIDSLQNAMSLRLQKRGEKVLEQALNGHNHRNNSNAAKGILQAAEENEPSSAATRKQSLRLHRRETADGGQVDN